MFYDFVKNRRGSISVLSAGAFCALLAVTSLVVEGSSLYVMRVRQQRTADFAALAAGSVTNAISDGSVSAAAIATAKNIATINGFSASGTVVTTTGDRTQIGVTISKTANFNVTSLFSSVTAATSRSAALSTPTVGAISCVVSLAGEVALEGGSTLTGNNCGVTANTYLGLNASGINVKAATVGYSSSDEAPRVSGATALAPPLRRFRYSTPATDGLVDEAAISSLNAKLGTMAFGWPYETSSPKTITLIPTSSGTNVTHVNTLAIVGLSARIGALSISNSSVRFNGMGPADPNCTFPTSISGPTTLSGNSILVFSSGCYIFQGDVTLTSGTTVTFAAAPGARIRFVFGGAIINQDNGTLVFPAATYSIANGLANQGGGSFKFGAGPKVIGGTIDNGTGVSDLGAGPFYFPATTIRQNTGTLRFGAGPFYIYDTSIINGQAGTMRFGKGPYYIYRSTITNGDARSGAAPLMSFAGGLFASGSSQVVLNPNSTTTFGAGDLDFYSSNLLLAGERVTFGSSATTASGAGTLSISGGFMDHSAGEFVGNGITIAQVGGLISLSGRNLFLSAPTASSPTAGYQNLLLYNAAGALQISPQNTGNVLGGVIYAPGGSIELVGSTYSNPSPGCLSMVAGIVRFSSGAAANLAPCSNFPGLLGAGPRAMLGG